MIKVTILVLCAVSALGHPTKSQPPVSGHGEESSSGSGHSGHPIEILPPIPEYAKDFLLELVNLNRDFRSFIHLGLSKFAKDVNTALKLTVDNFLLLPSPVINFGKHGIEHFLDGGTHLFSGFPLLGSAVELGNRALEIQLSLWEALRIYFLHSAKLLVDSNVDSWNDIELRYLSALEDASQVSAGIIRQSITDEVNKINTEHENVFSSIDTANEALHNEDEGKEGHKSS